ncbi:MAG: JAB domain-containing protein [Leptospirales bacterium]
MTDKPRLPGLGHFESEPLSASKLRDEPDWALVERITGKKCPETVSLRTLSRMTETELKETLGLTDIQGKKLGAALVLGERLANEPIERGASIKNGEDVYRIFKGQLKDARKEGFYAISLDQKHKVIDLHQISEGTLSMCPVHPREAFNPIIRDSAAAVIFLHNHPSGNPEPSSDDWSLTERLAESGKLLGIRVLDHVVMGNGAFVSLRDRGAIREEPGVETRAAENTGGVKEPLGRYKKETTPSSPGRQNREVHRNQESVEREMGRTAFHRGLSCTPVNDQDLMDHLQKNSAKVGESIPKLKDWLAGWHEENLKTTPAFTVKNPSPHPGNDPGEPSRDVASGKTQDNPDGKTRTFLVAPRENPGGSPSPDYTGLIVIGKTPHKIDLWKDGQIQIARQDADRFTAVGSGRLAPSGPGELSGPVPVRTAPDAKTSVKLAIRGIGNGTPVRLSVSEGRTETFLQKNPNNERGIGR